VDAVIAMAAVPARGHMNDRDNTRSRHVNRGMADAQHAQIT
jgi:hypothetical protein